MRIVFVYRGRYQIRDAVILEYLSAIASQSGHKTGLVYDQDIFGVSDNVLYLPFINRLLSNRSRVIEAVLDKKPDLVVFLDGFNRGPWNEAMAGGIKNKSGSVNTLFISYWEPESRLEVYDHVLIGEPEYAFKRFLSDKSGLDKPGIKRYQGLADLDRLPLPDKSLFGDHILFAESYLIYTSKGCPYHCSYCEETVYGRTFGRE